MNRNLNIAFAFIFLVGIYSPAGAASPLFSIHAPSAVPPGSEFDARFSLTSDTPLNAYLVRIRLPSDIIEDVRFDNSKSIIDAWQSQPQAYQDGRIEFAGGSFRPFSGTGELLTVRFRALREGAATLGYEQSEAYIADGKGTKAEGASSPFAIAINLNAPSVRAEEVADSAPPTISTLSLENDPFNPNQKLLTFLVEDRDSGIKETLARYKTFVSWSEWQPVQNPTAFPASVWAVEFKARDNVGNPTASIIYYWPVLFRNFLPFIALVLLGAGFLLFRRRKQKNL